MKLKSMLSNVERRYFVGREKELYLMQKHAAGKWKWPWLHIYGQSGIGKSTILQQFMIKPGTDHIYFVDGSKTIFQKEDVLAQLSKQLKHTDQLDSMELDSEKIAKEMIRQSQLDGCGIMIIMDAFENWRSVEDWLAEWLGQLEDSVRIISAGRHPLTGSWLRSGWASMIYSLQLPSLTPVEVDQYANNRGLTNADSKLQLFQFSRGNPLAMTLAAETILRGNHRKSIAREEKFELIAVLMEELLCELPSSVRKLFEAASVFWRFNEERIGSVLKEDIDPLAFRKLTSMPFVFLKEDSWMIHDAVRSWALEDIMLRKPQTYEQMRQRALTHIRLEEQQNLLLRQKLHLDKMSLHQNPLVRNICFSGHLDEVEIRECRERDLPAIKDLYTRYLDFASGAAPGERHMADLIYPVWQADPSSYITFWKADELIAFFGKVPLHKKMLGVLAQEPLLKPFLSGWKPTPKSYLLCFMGIEPELAEKTRSYILNTMLNHFSLSEWILDFTCLKEWFPVFELCGFDRAAWADATTEWGTEYRAFILDLTQEDFLTKLDRCLSKHPPVVPVTPIDPAQHLLEFKTILKELPTLPRNPLLIEKFAQLFPHRVIWDQEDPAKAGTQIQKELMKLINQIGEGNERNATLSSILKYTYVQGLRPQERVAERFNLSMATYYRHLNKAIELLYQSCQN
nr:DUF1492 domain-containing protein [Neobacillus sp. Marseille-Q6967]